MQVRMQVRTQVRTQVRGVVLAQSSHDPHIPIRASSDLLWLSAKVLYVETSDRGQGRNYEEYWLQYAPMGLPLQADCASIYPILNC